MHVLSAQKNILHNFLLDVIPNVSPNVILFFSLQSVRVLVTSCLSDI